MASHSNDWYFTKEQLENTPSKQCGVEPYKELSYRQQAANFIQDMGQKLKVSQLCINTAIVYMHRFYVFHSFTRFPWNSIAAAAIFLAAKVEEQPRKLEHVIRVVNLCKNPHDKSFDTNSERYLAQSQELVFNENVLLQTLGFDVAIDHPHTHVVRCCHLVRASKDLAQTSYFMASNSLHLTTMCLQYKPTVVACFCIHFVCKWSNWEIPLSNEKKEWFSYVDETVTTELLEQLTKEFLFIYDRCPSRLKEKIMAIGDGLAINHSSGSHPSSPFEPDKKFVNFPTCEQIQKDPHGHSNRAHHTDGKLVPIERPLRLPHEPGSSGQHRDREWEYKERKERERMGHHIKASISSASSSNKHAPPPHGHHSHPMPVDPKLNKHVRPPSSGHPSNARLEPRDILREATRDIGLRDYKEPSRESLSKDSVPRDATQVRSNDKRDYVYQRQEVKPISAVELNNVTNVNYPNDKRVDSNRPRSAVDPKLQKRREEVKPYNKLESDIKKHLSAAIHDKNSSLLHKPVNSASQKVKSPFASEVPKTVPNHHTNQSNIATIIKSEIKTEPHNGSSNSNGNSFGLPLIENDFKPKLETLKHDEPVPVPSNIVKKPSLFSPEKSPPQKKPKVKTPPSSGKKSEIPVTSALPTTPSFDSQQNNATAKRSRTSSTNSEPELRPVMKKIDQVQGFENLMRDSSIGIKLHHQVPDIITPISDIKQEKTNVQTSIAKELKPPDLIPPFNASNTSNTTTPMTQPIINGIETNPTLISSLLKEAPSQPHLPAVVATTSVASEPKEREHKEHKKNKKEKHKHKDKEKNREEKEKKKKHKDKDREKHKHKHDKREEENVAIPAQPIKITISKDKIQPVQPIEHPLPIVGVKIKIPKDRIKPDSIGESSAVAGSLKIKIPKDVINNYSNENSVSKKRERDRSSPSSGPPHKISKSNHNRTGDMKSSKNSFSKVSNLNNNNNNVNEATLHNVQTSMYSNNMTHLMHSVYTDQNAASYFYNYPPPNMQMPVVAPRMNVPPPSYMYQQYYPTGYMYTSDMYGAVNPSISGEVPPPLPHDPPPNNPPPPPPEF